MWVGPLWGTAWVSRSFFHWFNPCWVLQSEVMGTYIPGTRTVGWWAWCGAGTPCSRDSSPEFLSTTHGCGTSLFCISASPTSMGGCGFFNSVVVRLPFNSIFWWFWVMLVLNFICNFHVLVRGGEPCLPMLPSWMGVLEQCLKWKSWSLLSEQN